MFSEWGFIRQSPMPVTDVDNSKFRTIEIRENYIYSDNGDIAYVFFCIID